MEYSERVFELKYVKDLDTNAKRLVFTSPSGLFIDESLLNDVGPSTEFPNFQFTQQNNPIILSVASMWIAVPGAANGVVHLDQAWTVLFTMSAYIDTVVNNNQICLDVNLTGANTIDAGSVPQDILRVGGKTATASTSSITTFYDLQPGDTAFTPYYTAEVDGGLASYLTINVVGIRLI